MDKLEPTYFYHIYNRGNNKQDIFKNEGNYQYFLRLFKKHIDPIADVFCYCLLNNHFHLVIRIKEQDRNSSQAFSNFFNAYTKAFNKQQERVGSLFQRPFRRVQITSEKHLQNLIIYIHQNPENHKLIDDFRNHTWSSYNSILSEQTTQLKRVEIIEIFDNIENFKFCHRKLLSNDNLKDILFD